MGIDPLTHKPLSEQEASQQAQGSKKSLEPHANDKNPKQDQEDQENKDNQDQHHTEQDLEKNNTSASSNGFCVDEVPLLSPHEILIDVSSSYQHHHTNDDNVNINTSKFTSPSSSSSSTSSCISSSVVPGDEFSKFFDEMENLDLKWLSSDDSSGENIISLDGKFTNTVDTMNLWDDINDLSSLDMFMNDHDHDGIVGNGNGCSRMVLDQDSWTFDLLI